MVLPFWVHLRGCTGPVAGLPCASTARRAWLRCFSSLPSSRAGYAKGSLRAARYLAQHKRGLHSMYDVLGLNQ